jgi:hypothetical protein
MIAPPNASFYIFFPPNPSNHGPPRVAVRAVEGVSVGATSAQTCAPLALMCKPAPAKYAKGRHESTTEYPAAWEFALPSPLSAQCPR